MQLRHVAIATVGATIGLMVIGSLVHGTGSSLACPDWPLCHGTAFPAMAGGVEFEHTHRLVAAAVVALAVVLFVGAWRRRDRVVRALATGACALVAVQATLGGLTVIFRLPPAISIAHLATSMTFLSTLVLMAVRLAPASGVRAAPSGARGWIGAAAIAVFAQIVLGGVVRHTGAALACPDLPLCAGRAWPAAASQWIHMAHRGLGALAGVATVAIAIAASRRTRGRGRRWILRLPALVVVAQIALGASVVALAAPLWLVTAHHATGAVLLASLVLAWATIDGRIAAGESDSDAARARAPEAGCPQESGA